MASMQTAGQVLERHYLEIRCELLNLAAALDRLERAESFERVSHDPRLDLIRRGIEIVGSAGDDRAERLQLLFSDEYLHGWNTDVPV